MLKAYIRPLLDATLKPLVRHCMHDEMAALRHEILASLVKVRFDRFPHHLENREEFGYYLNHCGLVGIGAEVGVFKAHYSSLLLKTWHGRKLYSIDPWQFFSDRGEDAYNTSTKEQDALFKETTRRLRPYGKRSEVLRLTSEAACLQFEDGQLDFVYIDAHHQYEAVKTDIERWYPKVKVGGILAGHDYFNADHGGSYVFGVKKAVDEFFDNHDGNLMVSQETEFPSWFMIKGTSS